MTQFFCPNGLLYIVNNRVGRLNRLFREFWPTKDRTDEFKILRNTRNLQTINQSLKRVVSLQFRIHALKLVYIYVCSDSVLVEQN